MIDKKVIRFKINQLIHRLSTYEQTVWIIGSGRSGTTWLSSLINYKKNYRELYEPFHPTKVNFLFPHQYLTLTNVDKSLSDLIEDVFSGRFLAMSIDKSNDRFHYKNLLIKDIFANLFANYVHIRFPNVKIILLIRNPFAVALSKFKTKSWYWMNNPMDFLKQKELLEDYLMPYESLIREVSRRDDLIEKYILIWSVINFIPLIQFKSGEIYVAFYENFVSNPNKELEKLNLFINPEKKVEIKLPEEVINTPSRVTSKGSSFDISWWREVITSDQFDEGNRILEHFGLKNLYNADFLPNDEVLKNIRSKF